jgi:hypothetical protein
LIDPTKDDDSNGDEEDYEESMSMYEEDEYDLHQSFDEIEDLQSYRNQHNANVPDHNDILNESTADFNKQIK